MASGGHIRSAIEMNDRTRFCKAYIMTTEKAPKWVATLVTDRLRCRHNNIAIVDYIKKLTEKKILQDNDQAIKSILNKGTQIHSADQLDISVLAKLIRKTQTPSIIDTGESRTPSYGSDRVGDLVERIVQRRNQLVHTPNVNLSVDEYNDIFDAIREIGSKFEKINFPKPAGAYCKEIDDVHEMVLDDTEVKKVVERYKAYLTVIINTEIQVPDLNISVTPSTSVTTVTNETKNESFAEGMARAYTSDIDNPVGKFIVGGVTGTIGLGFDVVTSPFRVFASVFRRT